MIIVTVAVTAIVVSLDSFMAGFSLSLNKRPSTLLPSAVALITLLLCLLTSFVGQMLSDVAERAVDYFGGALLLLLALFAAFRKEETHATLVAVTVGESLTIGVAVGMDAAIANFSFAGSAVARITPIVFGVTHYATVALGQVLARRVQLAHTNIISAVILAVLAVTKFL